MMWIFQTSSQVEKKTGPEQENWLESNTRKIGMGNVYNKAAPKVVMAKDGMGRQAKNLEESNEGKIWAWLAIGSAINAYSLYKRGGHVKNAAIPHYAITLQENLEKLVLDLTYDSQDAYVRQTYRDAISKYARQFKMSEQEAKKLFAGKVVEALGSGQLADDLRKDLKGKSGRLRPWAKLFGKIPVVPKIWKKQFWTGKAGMEARLPGAIDAVAEEFGIWNLNFSQYMQVKGLPAVKFAQANANTVNLIYNQLANSGAGFRNEKKTKDKIMGFLQKGEGDKTLTDANGVKFELMKNLDAGQVEIFAQNKEFVNGFKAETGDFTKRVLKFFGSEWGAAWWTSFKNDLKGQFGWKLLFEQEQHVINKKLAKLTNVWENLLKDKLITQKEYGLIKQGADFMDVLAQTRGAEGALKGREKIANKMSTITNGDANPLHWWGEKNPYAPSFKQWMGNAWDKWGPRWSNAEKGAELVPDFILSESGGPVTFAKEKALRGWMKVQSLKQRFPAKSVYSRQVAYAVEAGLVLLAIYGIVKWAESPATVRQKKSVVDRSKAPDFVFASKYVDAHPEYEKALKEGGRQLRGSLTTGAAITYGKPLGPIDANQESTTFGAQVTMPPDWSDLPGFEIRGNSRQDNERAKDLMAIKITPDRLKIGIGEEKEFYFNPRPKAGEQIRILFMVYNGTFTLRAWDSQNNEIVPYTEIREPEKSADWNYVYGALRKNPAAFSFYQTVWVYPLANEKYQEQTDYNRPKPQFVPRGR